MLDSEVLDNWKTCAQYFMLLKKYAENVRSLHTLHRYDHTCTVHVLFFAHFFVHLTHFLCILHLPQNYIPPKLCVHVYFVSVVHVQCVFITFSVASEVEFCTSERVWGYLWNTVFARM